MNTLSSYSQASIGEDAIVRLMRRIKTKALGFMHF